MTDAARGAREYLEELRLIGEVHRLVEPAVAEPERIARKKSGAIAAVGALTDLEVFLRGAGLLQAGDHARHGLLQSMHFRGRHRLGLEGFAVGAFAELFDLLLRLGENRAAMLDEELPALVFHERLFERLRAVLRPGGILVSAVSKPDQKVATRHGVRALFFLVNVTSRHLAEIAGLIDGGQLRTRVGAVLPLEDAREVLAIVGAGMVGKGSLATCNEVFPWEEVRVWSRPST